MARKEMSTAQITAWMAQVNEARTLRHRAKVYASALMQRFLIRPHGIDLVCWLADASCRTNENAIVQWVQSQLASTAADDAPDIDELSARLSRLLDAARESYAQ
jgi:hypothetical protein